MKSFILLVNPINLDLLHLAYKEAQRYAYLSQTHCSLSTRSAFSEGCPALMSCEISACGIDYSKPVPSLTFTVPKQERFGFTGE